MAAYHSIEYLLNPCNDTVFSINSVSKWLFSFPVLFYYIFLPVNLMFDWLLCFYFLEVHTRLLVQIFTFLKNIDIDCYKCSY